MATGLCQGCWNRRSRLRSDFPLSHAPAVDNEAFHKPPFFKPAWWPDIAGMILGSHVDWREVSALITVSYRMLAPKKLAERMR
jgi:hypothetical protein